MIDGIENLSTEETPAIEIRVIPESDEEIKVLKPLDQILRNAKATVKVGGD